MRFTVVIPTFDRAGLVGRAIDSVLAQSYREFTLVVVDDGSTDETAQVVASFNDPRLVYVRQENAGVSAARNRGVAQSDEPYVVFLDSDDRALPGWLEAFAASLSSGADLVSAGACLIEAAERRFERPRRLGRAFGDLTALPLAGCYAMTRDLWHKSGGFTAGLAYSENTELFLRLGTLALSEGFRCDALSSCGIESFRRTPDCPPERRFDSAAFLVQHRRTELGRDRRELATYWAIAGSSARRSGRPRTALRCHVCELAVRPSAKGVARLIVALAQLPGAGRQPQDARLGGAQPAPARALSRHDAFTGVANERRTDSA